MPKVPVPLQYIDLLEGNVMAHLATVDGDGCPQVNPVWILWDADTIVMSMLEGTRKLANIQGWPHVALSLLDPEDSNRYLELRGHVTRIERYDDLSLVNLLARKYTGRDFRGARHGEIRYRVVVTVTSWTAQG